MTTLRRELGKWDLTAIGINQVIGSAVFLLPSQVAAQVGSWSPLAFLAIGLASLLVALCFAEVGSRFEGTGGPYLYTRAAFGRFAGFEVGWMQWVTRVTSQAAIANAVALALGFYWPAVTGATGRAVTISAITLSLGWINLRGIRLSAFVVNGFTIAKLVPLALFIVVGLWFIEGARLVPSGSLTPTQVSTAALLLIFAFGGYDVIGVPAGEAANPRRHLPFAFIVTILCVTAIMTLAQIVALGALPNLPASKTPLADASMVFAGAAGALVISVGSVVSMTGNNLGAVLTGSRMLFALAENGELPRFFVKIHPRYRTPSNAIVFTTLVALGLALSGSFAILAVASAVARLVAYTGACAATLRLRSTRFDGTVQPATFVIPLGPVVPVLAIVVSLMILAGATRAQLLGGAVGLAAGAVLFALNNARNAMLRIICVIIVSLGCVESAFAQARARNVVIVTIDGLRWQELFGGADGSYFPKEPNGEPTPIEKRYARPSADERRAVLMPFMWTEIAKHGQIFGDPSRQSRAHVTNGLWFSYPGYDEMFSGAADPRIDSNDKVPNPNVTVLEWLNTRPAFAGKVAAFGAWDRLPFILNVERSRLPVGFGFSPVPLPRTARQREINAMAQDLPPLWSYGTFDAPIVAAAMECLRVDKPRVMYVMLGEGDEWAHRDRYDLYLDATQRADRFIQRLWAVVQSMPEYKGRTALLITTDHGRGATVKDWSDHGRKVPAAESTWIAAMGAGVAPLGVRERITVTASQLASTIAALVGEDYALAAPKAAPPLPLRATDTSGGTHER